MAAHSDEQQTTHMLTGDPQTFQQLVEKHIGPLTHYVSRLTGNPTETEEIVQETFVRLWTKRDTYDPSRSQLSTWLHRVAHNLFIDRLRERQHEVEDIGHEVTSLQGPDVTFDEGSQRQQIEKALMTLPVQQRGALALFHYQGLSLKEVASTLDISTDAVDSLLRRARASLRKKLTETG